MFVEAQLTKSQYDVIRSKAKDRFLSYKKIQEAKKECYPDKKDFKVTETGAEIDLQGLLDHTVTQFGMSTLYAWIRFFECLINLSYKLPLQKWQARGAKNKEIIDIRKHETRQKFKSELGLIIDKPKPGYGSSNNGNTARRFFENAAVSSEITGIDIEVIKRFRTILRAMSSRYTIDLPRFQAYTLESAHLFVEKYSWYCMPPTIHKVLIHGPIIIETALLPIGQLSEEAQEANNKMLKKYREGYSRKISRDKTNEDIINRLLISSDPPITTNLNYKISIMNNNQIKVNVNSNEE
ncbi:hypothetical protein RN001_016456 [Aquatica leii]|uniref:Uncharacterized protein n=1 Tax=Aquatica leii TaxID=1421715 RepID=A0AAN7SJY5_9COLE|nr:hypothetical protein RN001_016456 [Aquatica leii]